LLEAYDITAEQIPHLPPKGLVKHDFYVTSKVYFATVTNYDIQDWHQSYFDTFKSVWFLHLGKHW